MSRRVIRLDRIDAADRDLVGAKAAHLGELARIDGIHVPPGFCITTAAFRQAVATSATDMRELLDDLSEREPDDADVIGRLSLEVRRMIEATVVPDDLAAEIVGAAHDLAAVSGLAVRSSATAEDLPTASFAGQHDSYLNVAAPDLLTHVRRCWASLFTERAVTYRLRSGLDHHAAAMAVVVQSMVEPHAAGVLFTADPVNGNRKVVAIESVFGLGDALVEGRATPDTYRVRDGVITVRTPADPTGREVPSLTDDQVLALARLGRRVEEHFGSPQDLEWCLADDRVWVVQSRPITTLFPIPEVEDDDNRVFVSVGHQQMMTDAMKPLGISFWQRTSRAPMRHAGGRIFIDVTQRLASETSRDSLLRALGGNDPLIGDALQAIVERGEFLPRTHESLPPQVAPGDESDMIDLDPAVVPELIARTDASIAELEVDIQGRFGPDLFDFIADDILEMQRLMGDPDSYAAIVAGVKATWWLNDRLRDWLGEKNPADTLAQSVEHNVTAQMGFALMDVADRIRPHPDVVAFLEQTAGDDWLDDLLTVPGGTDAARAIDEYLDVHGSRCVGEIDITRPRWRERPAALLPLILSNVRNFEPGAGRARFEQGRRQALAKRAELLERLRRQPDGERKAAETSQVIDQLRAFTGYREFPKFGMIRRYLIYKQALLGEARRLADAGVIDDPEDVFYLTLDEFRDVAARRLIDRDLVEERKGAFAAHCRLTPPRVITSEGEIITGSYRRDDVPDGVLVGLPVSAGTVEGRARIVGTMGDADLEPGDILVTAFTDPSWTPAFVAVRGLVTEAGGAMTHGAVIAREYGLPAVVGVEQATQLIREGQRIRVDGTDGYVTILE